jgi:hypothetical protein
MTAKHASTARMLLARLERLSADSPYAHRASGLRGSLINYLDQVEGSDPTHTQASPPAYQVEQLLSYGFNILEKAAREIYPTRR